MSVKLPTLWVNAEYNRVALRRSGASIRAYVGERGTDPGEVAYVPADALDAATEALRLERAETERLTGLLSRAFGFTCHDHYVGPCAKDAARDRASAPCTCGLDALVAEVKSSTAALSPRPGAKES